MYYTGHNRVVICNLLSLRGLQVPWDIPKNKLTIHLQTDWNWCLFCTSIHPSHITWPENRWWNIQSHQNRSSFLALRLHREWTSVGVAGRWKHRRFVCLLCPFGGGESLLNCFMYLNRSQLPVVPCQLRMNGWFSWLTITILSKWTLIPPKKYRQNLNWTFSFFVGCIDVERQERSLDFFVSPDAMLPTTSTSAKKPMDFHPNVPRSPTWKCKCHLWTTPESAR